MSQSNLKRIVNAFVISRIDYCNSILYGLPTFRNEKLQRVQNIAARLITGSSRRDHITPVLKNLHWLPVKLRTFKILLLTYKILNGQIRTFVLIFSQSVDGYNVKHNGRITGTTIEDNISNGGRIQRIFNF